MKLFLTISALYFFAFPVHSMDIYRWTDDAGKIHMSDVVPEKYKAAAKLVNYRKDNISGAERQNAEAKLNSIKRKLVPEQVTETSTPTIFGDPKPVEPAQQITCSQKWDAYYRSQECFAQYMIRNGLGGSTLRPEAHQNCQEVKTPSMECEYDKRQSKQ